MKIKSLLVGASGLVGSEILKYLHERDQDITIYGEGKQTRSFCFVDEFVFMVRGSVQGI